ncbi:MAG: winged helix-turn-helix transcriptional regulator [Clostridia bacterium]|nr:winged helix-turn-helix transcriptional regulator [Clostridia bacterium]
MFSQVFFPSPMNRMILSSSQIWPQATPRMLSKQLKELEEDGVINRILYPVVPPKTEYSLTEIGQTLVPIVDALCKWGEHYFELAGLPVPCE